MPSTDPLLIATDRPQAFEAVAYDDQQQDVTSEVTWSWDFDDGSAADTDNPTEHVFETAGDYTVTVTGVWSAQQQQDDAQITIDAQVGTGTFVLARQLAADVYQSLEGDEMCHTRYVIAWQPPGRWYDGVSFNSKYEWVPEFAPQPWFTELQQITLDNVQRYAWVAEWTSSECPGQAEAGEFNAPVNWQIVGKYLDGVPPDEVEVYELIGEKTWTINNTVVSSPTGVLFYDPDDEELDSCEISWTTTHQNVYNVKFVVPIHIYDLDGNELYTYTKTDVPLGNDSWIWHGEIVPQEPEGPDQAGKGVYTYRLGVVGESGSCGGVRCVCTEPGEGCARGDWDKSAFLTVGIDKFYWCEQDPEAGTLTGVVKYTLNQPAWPGSVTIRFFGPDLEELDYPLTGQPYLTGTHFSDVYQIDAEYDENDQLIGPIYCVIYANECEDTALLNRAGDSKPALQMGGSTLQQGPVDLDIAGTTEATEETVGGFVVLNSEDDDGDETADRTQTGTVTDEDDLIAIAIAYEGSGELKLEATQGGGRVKVWTSATKGTQVTLPATWQVPNNPPPAQLYVEGIAVSEDARDVELRLSLTVGGAEVGFDTVRATVWDVESVEWYAINSALDTNPNPGGGQRIFPGKATPEDEVDRSEVGVRVQVTPVVEGVEVIVRVTDPDDPYTDDEPIDPNSSAGNDNRGTAGGLTEDDPVTDANGIAETTFTVSMQPGDNFRARAGATVDHLLFAGAYEESGLLTVWRKLHTEVDSMGVPSGVVETALITAVNDNGNDTISVTTDVDLDDSPNRFVPGEFTDGVGVWPILGNTAGQNFVVTVEKVHGGTLPSVNVAFEAADDDVIPADVPDPITTVMVDKFASAYVLPVFDGGGDPDWDDPDAPFALNLSDYNGSAYGGLEAQAQLSRDSASTQVFWTLHCLGCFQGILDGDNDPGTEGCIQGISNGKTALVFSEHHREYSQTEDHRAHTLVHEIGHSFGLEDQCKWQPPPYPADPNYNGIMYWVWKGVFTDGNIAGIRSIDCPSALFFYQY